MESMRRSLVLSSLAKVSTKSSITEQDEKAAQVYGLQKIVPIDTQAKSLQKSSKLEKLPKMATLATTTAESSNASLPTLEALNSQPPKQTAGFRRRLIKPQTSRQSLSKNPYQCDIMIRQPQKGANKLVGTPLSYQIPHDDSMNLK